MSRAAMKTGGIIRQGLYMVVLSAAALSIPACGGGDGGGDAPGGGGGNGGGGGGGATAQFVYVVNAGDAAIQAYRSDGDGNLTAVGTPVFAGNLPHHVNVDPAGRFLYVSNHDAPFLSGYRINQDATLTPMNPATGSPVTGADPLENAPHSSVMDSNRQHLYVVSGHGGPSTLRAYTIDAVTGIPTFIPGQNFSVGSHAHNIALSPNNQFVYVASEGTGDVHAFSRNTSTGALTPVGTISGLLGASAVTVDPQTRFVYVTYLNAVEVFQIGANGALTRIAPTSTFPTGNGPHSLAMHPNGQFLYTANINSATISVFRIDSATGALTEIQSPPPATGGDPNFVVVHPNGRTLYTADAANPGLDRLSRFTINADGTLTPAGVVETGNGTNGIGMTKF